MILNTYTTQKKNVGAYICLFRYLGCRKCLTERTTENHPRWSI